MMNEMYERRNNKLLNLCVRRRQWCDAAWLCSLRPIHVCVSVWTHWTYTTHYPGRQAGRQTDRKWIVIGREEEANRKHFPVNCLPLCSHVNAQRQAHTRARTHTHTRRLLQFSHVNPCCSRVFISTHNIRTRTSSHFYHPIISLKQRQVIGHWASHFPIRM